MIKLFKWVGIVVGSLTGLLALLVIILPFILPLDKIKDLATEKISDAINREVKIEKVSFNLFEGIKLNKLTISNRAGFAKQDFIAADSIVLRYAFWPIFQRQLIVKEISLVQPEILVEKSAAGEMNFSDMTKKKNRPVEARKGGKGQENFSIFVDSFSIKNARITYKDYAANQTSEIKNADLKINGITLSGLRPINLKFNATAAYLGKDIPLSLAGKLNLKLAEETLNITALVLKIAGEQANIAAEITRWKAGPDVKIAIISKQLSADPLLAIFFSDKPKAKKAKSKPGELTAKVNKSLKSLKPRLRVLAKIDIDNLSLLDFKVDKADLDFSLQNKKANLNIRKIAIYDGKLSGLAFVDLAQPGLAYQVKNLRLDNFNAAPFTNALIDSFLTKLENSQDLKDKVFGRLSASLALQCRGVETPDIMANAVADGSFNITGGEIRRMKILSQVGKTIKSNSLQEDLKFEDLAANFRYNQRVITTRDLAVGNNELKIVFNGGADLGKLNWVAGNRLALRLSPAATKGLSPEFNFLRDKDNWLEITFELTGGLKRPIPKPILDKPIEAAVGKIKAKIEAKQVEIVDEAKKKVEEEAKNQLKNLIKF